MLSVETLLKVEIPYASINTIFQRRSTLTSSQLLKIGVQTTHSRKEDPFVAQDQVEKTGRWIAVILIYCSLITAGIRLQDW